MVSRTLPPGGSRRQILWAEFRGWTQFIGLQIEYSLMERTVERLIPMAKALNLGALAMAAPLINTSGGMLLRLCDGCDRGLDSTDVVSRGEQDLQSSFACRHRDHVADFRKLVDIYRVILFARQSGNSASNVTGQGLHVFQGNHFDLSIPCLVCERLDVQLLVCG